MLIFDRASFCFCFFFQAEDGIRDIGVTGVQTCALPIWNTTGWRTWKKGPSNCRRMTLGGGRSTSTSSSAAFEGAQNRSNYGNHPRDPRASGRCGDSGRRYAGAVGRPGPRDRHRHLHPGRLRLPAFGPGGNRGRAPAGSGQCGGADWRPVSLPGDAGPGDFPVRCVAAPGHGNPAANPSGPGVDGVAGRLPLRPRSRQRVGARRLLRGAGAELPHADGGARAATRPDPASVLHGPDRRHRSRGPAGGAGFRGRYCAGLRPQARHAGGACEPANLAAATSRDGQLPGRNGTLDPRTRRTRGPVLRRGIPPLSGSRVPAELSAGGVTWGGGGEIRKGRCLGSGRHVEPLLDFQDAGLDRGEALPERNVRLLAFLQFGVRGLGIAVERLQKPLFAVAERLLEVVVLVLHFAPKLVVLVVHFAPKLVVLVVHFAPKLVGLVVHFGAELLDSSLQIAFCRWCV